MDAELGARRNGIVVNTSSWSISLSHKPHIHVKNAVIPTYTREIFLDISTTSIQIASVRNLTKVATNWRTWELIGKESIVVWNCRSIWRTCREIRDPWTLWNRDDYAMRPFWSEPIVRLWSVEMEIWTPPRIACVWHSLLSFWGTA